MTRVGWLCWTCFACRLLKCKPRAKLLDEGKEQRSRRGGKERGKSPKTQRGIEGYDGEEDGVWTAEYSSMDRRPKGTPVPDVRHSIGMNVCLCGAGKRVRAGGLAPLPARKVGHWPGEAGGMSMEVGGRSVDVPCLPETRCKSKRLSGYALGPFHRLTQLTVVRLPDSTGWARIRPEALIRADVGGSVVILSRWSGGRASYFRVHRPGRERQAYPRTMARG